MKAKEQSTPEARTPIKGTDEAELSASQATSDGDGDDDEQEQDDKGEQLHRRILRRR